MSAVDVEVRKRRVFLGMSPFGERITHVVVELKCLQCGRWGALSPQVLAKDEVFLCPGLGCEFRARYDFRDMAAQIADPGGA